MPFERLADVQWGLLAHATLRYSVLAVGLLVAVAFGFSTVVTVDFGLLALLLVFFGIALLVIASNGGPRTSSYAMSIEPGARSMPDSSGIAAAPIGNTTIKMVFVAIGLIVWGGLALVLSG